MKETILISYCVNNHKHNKERKGMASFINKLMRKLLNVNNARFSHPEFRIDTKGQWHLIVQAKVNKRDGSFCPVCGRRCPGYDRRKSLRRWRSLDLGGLIVEIECSSVRVECPEHGVVTEPQSI